MAGTTRLELATSAVTGSVVRFYKNLEDRGDCQSTRKSSKTSHFVDWVVGWKLARSSEEFASAYATRAEHFLDGLWLDSADLHSCPIGRGKGIVGATGLEPVAPCAQGRQQPSRKSFLSNLEFDNIGVRPGNGCGWMWLEVLAHAWSPHTFPHSENRANLRPPL